MRKKMIWGFATLIILIIGVSVFFLMQNTDTAPDVIYTDREPSEIMQTPITENRPPRAARTGYKWEWHGDHWHEMPVEQTVDDTSVAQDVPVTQTYDGPLTYHEELLKTNPVKALRLQSEERGHFSAQWIPPFPPDDTEAQTYARTEYLITYYQSIGEADTPEYKAAVKNNVAIGRAIGEYPHGARKLDLMKLGWVNFDEQPFEMYHPHGFRASPSDYFPRWRSETEKRAHYEKSGFYDLFMQIEKLQEQGLLPE